MSQPTSLEGLSPTDLQSILTFTVDLARRAGNLILEGSEALLTAGLSDINEKKNSVDLVTEYDLKVEELLQTRLEEKYPSFKFIGEESYSAGSRPPLTDEPTFCVDPIDGTTNFIHGLPFVCISLGLIYRKRPILGVIYNPFLNHLYTGIKGQGSYLTRSDGVPLKLPLSASPKPLPSLSHAVISVEWGSERTEKSISSKARGFGRLAGNPDQGVLGGKMVHSLRSLGSAALNISLVAQGGVDLFWEIGCWPWDVCAGIVIVEEAGGLVTGSHNTFAATSHDDRFGQVTEDILTGRKYLVVRGISPNPGETSIEAQKRIIQEFYDTVEDIDPN